jgi:hypothetical protein
MSKALKLAQHYFDLSNQGKLEDIAKLFTESSTYSSVTTGLYFGVDSIMKMQSEFFSNYQSMAWHVNSVEEIKPGIVLFDFTFNGTTNEGEIITRDGLEYVIVYKEKIQHIEVRNKE